MPRCKGWLRKLRGEEKLKRAPTEAGSLQVGDVHRLRACVRLGLLALFLVDRVRLAAAAALRLSLHLSTGRWLVGRGLGGATGDATVRLRLEQVLNFGVLRVLGEDGDAWRGFERQAGGGIGLPSKTEKAERADCGLPQSTNDKTCPSP